MNYKRSLRENIVFGIILIGIIAFTLVCIYPFYYILIYSLSNPAAAGRSQVVLWPVGFTFDNFKLVLSDNSIYSAFLVSLSRTVLGTLLSLFCSSLFAYVLMQKKMIWPKFFYRMSIASMFVSAGLIPWYITMVNLGFKNNYLVYIIPTAVSAYYVMLVRVYITESINPGMEEAARIDGAGFMTIFIKIIIPLCRPVLAALAVFSAVGQWNMWTDNFFLVSDENLQTLQMKLMQVLRQSEVISQIMTSHEYQQSLDVMENYKVTPMAVRTTIAMVTTLPVLFVYPLLQKQFVKGIMIGAIKG